MPCQVLPPSPRPALVGLGQLWGRGSRNAAHRSTCLHRTWCHLLASLVAGHSPSSLQPPGCRSNGPGLGVARESGIAQPVSSPKTLSPPLPPPLFPALLSALPLPCAGLISQANPSGCECLPTWCNGRFTAKPPSVHNTTVQDGPANKRAHSPVYCTLENKTQPLVTPHTPIAIAGTALGILHITMSETNSTVHLFNIPAPAHRGRQLAWLCSGRTHARRHRHMPVVIMLMRQGTHQLPRQPGTPACATVQPAAGHFCRGRHRPLPAAFAAGGRREAGGSPAHH